MNLLIFQPAPLTLHLTMKRGAKKINFGVSASGEEKQKEILDSIRYAKRIQLSQISTEKRVSQILNRLKGHEGK